MDFRLTESQLALQIAARRFATEQLPEVAARLEHAGEALPREWLRRYAELGFLGVNLPEQHGGLGLGNLEALIVIEEFAKISSAVAFPVFESSVGPIKMIEHLGSDELRNRMIPAVCRGEAIV